MALDRHSSAPEPWRYLSALVLLAGVPFSTFGFLTVWEVPAELRWSGWLLYGLLGLGGLAGAIRLLWTGWGMRPTRRSTSRSGPAAESRWLPLARGGGLR
jgi:hypothetical protein